MTKKTKSTVKNRIEGLSWQSLQETIKELSRMKRTPVNQIKVINTLSLLNDWIKQKDEYRDKKEFREIFKTIESQITILELWLIKNDFGWGLLDTKPLKNENQKSISSDSESETGRSVTDKPGTMQDQEIINTITEYLKNILTETQEIKNSSLYDKRLKQFKAKPLESWDKLFIKVFSADNRIYLNNHCYSPSEIGFKPRSKGEESKYFIYFKGILYIMDQINKGKKIPNRPIEYNKRNLNAINSKIKSLTGLDTGLPIQYLNGMYKINFKFKFIDNEDSLSSELTDIFPSESINN